MAFDEHFPIISQILRYLSFGVPQILLDEFRRVNGNVLFQELPHAARILERVVGNDISIRADLVVPSRAIVIAFRLLVTGKQTLGVSETFLHQIGSVGERFHVVPLHLVFFDAVIDDSHQECDVGALADRGIEVGDRRGSREAGIDDDQLGAAIGLRFRDPFEATRMGFGGIAAHNDDEICILDVSPGICHCSTAVGWGQTGHRRAVSNACLIIECQEPDAACDFVSQPGRFVTGRRGRKHSGTDPPVDRLPIAVLGDEVFVAIVLHQPGNAVERVVPRYPFELVRPRLADLRIKRSRFRMNKFKKRGSLRTQRAAVGGMIGIAFDVRNLGLLTFREIAF